MNQPAMLKYWLALHRVESIGSVGFLRLLESFGSPERVFSAPTGRLEAFPFVGAKTAARIRDFRDWEQVEADLEKARSLGVAILPFTDPSYPARLLTIYDFPPLLYVRGELRADEACVAVVGSRAASTYGRYTAGRLSRELAMRGVTVVSGLARGIDTAAHQGTLAGKGRTIAVLGCGLDVTYPRENGELLEEIARRGAAITEYPFGTPPSATHFPARNRIISGLSLGVMVVEATEKSGSLITARLALEQGRDVFAVPGSIDAAGSRGTNRLIREGAKLVSSVDDILEEILPQLEWKDPLETGSVAAPAATKPGFGPAGAAIVHQSTSSPLPEGRCKTPPPDGGPEGPGGREHAILGLLSDVPATADEIIRASCMKANEALGLLMELELKGAIRRLPGKKFIRKE